jgi:hypothetical protein
MSARVLTGAIGDAYYIAADNLTKTGRLPEDVDIQQSLLNSIVEDFQRGETNKLLLAWVAQ